MKLGLDCRHVITAYIYTMTIEETIQNIRSKQEELQITLFPRVPERVFDEFEQKLSLKLPEDLRTFYSFSNGFEGGDDLFRIIPLDEILSNMNNAADNKFIIAEYMVYSDIWVLELSAADANKYSIFYIGQDSVKITLTGSLAEFIERWMAGGVFGKGGLFEWRKEIKN